MKKTILLLSLGTGIAAYKDTGADIASQIYDNKTFFQTYYDAEYLLNGKHTHATMIAFPLINEMKPDIVFFVGTVKSAWLSLYSTLVSDEKRSREDVDALYQIETNNGKNTSESSLIEIQNRIQGIFEKSGIFQSINGHALECGKILLIKYGLDKEELQYNYKKLSCISEYMSDPDLEYEVSFDITHSFRSLPLYNLAILNYLKALSSATIRIVHVFYGNLDVRKENNDIATIIDLGDIVNVMDLTAAVSEFKNTGSVRSLYPFVPDGDNQLAAALDDFDWATQTNDLNTMQTSIVALRKELKSRDSTPRYTDLCEMLIKVLNEQFPSEPEFDEIRDLSHKPWALGNVQTKIGRAFLNQNRYGQAMLAGTEAIISLMIPYYLSSKNIEVDEFSCRSWTYRGKVNIEKLVKKNLKEEKYAKLLSELHDLFPELKNDRNMVAHIGECHRTLEESEKELKRNVTESKKRICQYFERLEELNNAFQNNFDEINRVFCLMFRKKKEEKDKIEAEELTEEITEIQRSVDIKNTKIQKVFFEAHSLNLSEKTLRRMNKRKRQEATVIGISKKRSITGVLPDGRAVVVEKRFVTRPLTIAIGDKINVKLMGKENDEHPKGVIL